MAVIRTTARNNARVEPEEVRTCQLCRRVLSRKQDLPRHMSLHKPPQERMKEKTPCPIEGCTHRASQLSNLRTHIRRHTGEFLLCPFNRCPFTSPDPATIYRHKRDVHGYKPVPRKTKKQAPTKKTRDRRTRVATPYDEEEEAENVAPAASSFSDIDTWSSRAISESPSEDPNTPTVFGAVNWNASSFLFANPYSATSSSSSSSDQLQLQQWPDNLQWEAQVPTDERLGEREEPVRPSSPLPFLPLPASLPRDYLADPAVWERIFPSKERGENTRVSAPSDGDFFTPSIYQVLCSSPVLVPVASQTPIEDTSLPSVQTRTTYGGWW